MGNTPGKSTSFKETVEKAQDDCVLTLELIRKFFRSAREYLKSYQEVRSLYEIKKLQSVKRKHCGAAQIIEGKNGELSKKGKYSRHCLPQ